MKAGPLATAAVMAAALCAFPAGAQAARGFTLGVAAGEVTDDSALVWAHATRSGRGTVEITTPKKFGGEGSISVKFVRATSANDNTVQAKLVDLSPDTTYYYRF